MNQLSTIFISFILVLGFATLAHAQQPLLELPDAQDANNKMSKPSTGLELLSKDELNKLYSAEKPKKQPEAAPPARIVNKSNELVVKPAQEEPPKYTTLQEELENDGDNLSSDGFDINKIWKHKPIMLMPNEVKVFNAAIARYKKSLIEPEPVTTEQAGEGVAVIEEPKILVGNYPLITLDSIIYRNKDNWSAWINGTRFTPHKMEALAGLTIKSISKHKVDINWQKPPKTNKTAEGDSLADIEDPFATETGIEDNSEPEIVEEEPEKPLPDNVKEIDDNNYVITLQPGQAFITDDFTLHEGRVVTDKIAEIYRQQQQLKQEISSQAVGASGEVEGAAQGSQESASQKERDEENVAKLLELYKKSGIENNELNK